MARGIDLEAVTPRFASKSIGCCKKFPGRNSIKGIATLTHWLTELSKEIYERLEKDEIENSRVAKQIVVSFTQQFNGEEVASTRCIPLNTIDVEIMVHDALEVIKRNTEVFFRNEQNTVLLNPITLLGITASKFDDIGQQKKNTIKEMFNKVTVTDATKKSENDLQENDEDPKPSSKKSDCKLSNIKSFFSAVKDDANEGDEGEPVIDDEFNIKTNSSMNGTVDFSTDSNPIHESTATEVIGSSSDLIEENETTPATPALIPMTDSSSTNHEGTEREKPGSSNQPDYTTTYVEFLRPTIPDEFFEACTQCNKKLLSVEMQSHLDMHLAFQLSQEQRIEFRSQLKTKQLTSPPVAKKPKLDRNTNVSGSSGSGSKVASNKSSSSSGSSGKGSLIKYFEQKKENAPESPASESSVKCDECGRFIEIESVGEHSDYHTAKNLQMEINSLSTSGVAASGGSSKNSKAKSRTDSTSTKRSIASFFQTTN